MAAHASDNGAEEKAKKKENRKEQRFPTIRASLKAQLAEKKRLVSGQGKNHEEQENTKRNQREV